MGMPQKRPRPGRTGPSETASWFACAQPAASPPHADQRDSAGFNTLYPARAPLADHQRNLRPLGQPDVGRSRLAILLRSVGLAEPAQVVERA